MKPSNSLRPKESFGEKDWDKEKASPGGGGEGGGLDEIKPPPASSDFCSLLQSHSQRISPRGMPAMLARPRKDELAGWRFFVAR